MANKETLIPQAHKLTVDEASKGGKKSAETRKRKKELRIAFEALLEKEFVDAKGVSKSGAELIAFKQFEKALKGDSRAFEVVRDTAGQKPADVVITSEISADVIDEIESAVLEDE